MRNKILGAVLAIALIAVAANAVFATTDTTKRFYDRSLLEVSHGTATCTMTAAVWTTATTVLTITPQAQHALQDVRVCFDLDKTTTGFATAFTSGTIVFQIARKTDGTNWRISQNTKTTALSGTNSAGQAIELVIGEVSPGEDVRVMITLSAETGDFVLPFLVYYRAGSRATLTPS